MEIAIKHDGVTHYFQTDDFYGIYDHVRWLGFDHYVAEDLASWAENAPEGSDYNLGAAYTVEIVE